MPQFLFLDTSAVTKRYVAEVGSAWVRSLTDPARRNECWFAAITRVELLAALQLRVRTGTLTPAEAQQAEQIFRAELNLLYRLRSLSDPILDRAMRLVVDYPLRAYDSVQLAAALAVQIRYPLPGPGLIFVSADHRLNLTAASEGLSVEDPNNHP